MELETVYFGVFWPSSYQFLHASVLIAKCLNHVSRDSTCSTGGLGSKKVLVANTLTKRAGATSKFYYS